jgi:hypothetical protein
MKGQILLIIVFALIFALFSIFTLLTPIKDKIIRIKEMESVYQALTNSEKGLEAGLLEAFKEINLSLNKTISTSSSSDCAGLNPNLLAGTCYQISYTPTGTLWNSNENFKDDVFIFLFTQNNELKTYLKSISDGLSGKNIRTTFVGPSR